MQRERLSKPASEATQNSENNYKENNYKVLQLGIVFLMRIHKQLMGLSAQSFLRLLIRQAISIEPGVEVDVTTADP